MSIETTDLSKLSLKHLSIADLVALHDNFVTMQQYGAKYVIINKAKFERVEGELEERMYQLFVAPKPSQTEIK